jgi:drug/metabolite transporter (DMT)-like permease
MTSLIPTINFKRKSTQWFVLLALAFIWGSSFILMKRGLVAFNATQVGTFRIFLAYLVLLPVALKHLKDLQWKIVLPLLAVGALGNLIPAVLFSTAQTVISSSFSGMLNSLTPLFTLLLGISIFGLKTKWFNVVGVFIGFVGALLLLSSKGKLDFTANTLIYAMLPVIATVGYGIAVNTIKKYLQNVAPVKVTALAFFLVGPFAGIALFSSDFVGVIQTHPKAMQSLAYISVLAVVGTAIAVIVFNFLIKETTALFASSVTYLIPVVAIMWGLIDGETVELNQLIGIVIILTGVHLINKSK